MYSTDRRGRLALAALGGFVIAGGWPFAWNLVTHGDPFASEFKRAALEAHGYGGAAGVPGVLDPGFWRYFVVMVIEPFWARFGSLGAGLANGSRGWWAYFALTAVIAAAVGAGSAVAWWSRPPSGDISDARNRLARALVVIAAAGLGVWIGANTTNPIEYVLGVRATMVVHWTPRHVMPLTAPLVAIGALGAIRATAWLPRQVRVSLGVLLLVGLSGLWAIVVRDVLDGVPVIRACARASRATTVGLRRKRTRRPWRWPEAAGPGASQNTCENVTVPPQNCRMRDAVSSSALAATSPPAARGAKMTQSRRVAPGATIVRAESDVGLPNGPFASAMVSRPVTWIMSFRIPAYSSPSRPTRRVTSPSIASAVVEPERQLRFDGAPVAHVDGGVDPGQRVALAQPSQQCLGRRSGLRGVDPEPPVHPANRGDDVGQCLLRRDDALRGGHGRFESRVPFNDLDVVDGQHARRHVDRDLR